MPHFVSASLEHFPFLHSTPSTVPPSVDPFTITTSTGFMPLTLPQKDLPSAFQPLNALLNKLPVVTEDGSPGLLAEYKLGPAVDEEFPDLTAEVVKVLHPLEGKPDLGIVTAIFRDYAFLASAYLLEPCWETWKKNPDDGYGQGRSILPAKIAQPLYKCAEVLDIPPFMSYAAAYSLYNYTLANPARGMAYSNLRLIRAFEKGLDPTSSEAGFVLTHVDMVKESHALVRGATAAIESTHDRESFNAGLRDIIAGMQKVEASMEVMWANSKPAEYLSFRTFIFGITSQSMFPNGVVYEGIRDNEPLFFRGESGANDSMIPLLDGLLQIPFPPTPLTKILHEFRSYRPKPHRDFLAWVREAAEEVGVKDFAIKDPNSAVLYLRLLDHVRSFRWRHWLFAREYIIRRTPHPTATGGSPIVTWLPNQLFAVLDLMVEVYEGFGGDLDGCQEMMETARNQREKLDKEVERWCQERGVEKGR